MTEIKHEKNGSKGSFDIYFEGRKAGSMTYTGANQDTFIIDHTEVSEEFSGKGLAKQLVFAGAEFARETGKKVLPLCTYAKSVFAKNAEIQDILA